MAYQNQNEVAVKKQPFSVFITGQNAQMSIQNTLQDTTRRTKFVASLVSAVSINQDLKECEYSTILSAALLGEALNLSPSPQLGHYYLIPFNDKKKGKVANFILGYKGYLQLAIRSGLYKNINVMEVREGEYKGIDKRSGDAIIEFISDDKDRLSRQIVGYYAYIALSSGFEKSMYWSKEKMLNHADTYSKAFNKDIYIRLQAGEVLPDMWKYSSFWYKSFDEMAFKTMLRQIISKWGVMSIDMQEAYTKDDTNGSTVNKRDYIEPIDDETSPSQTTVILEHQDNQLKQLGNSAVENKEDKKVTADVEVNNSEDLFGMFKE